MGRLFHSGHVIRIDAACATAANSSNTNGRLIRDEAESTLFKREFVVGLATVQEPFDLDRHLAGFLIYGYVNHLVTRRASVPSSAVEDLR